MTVSHARPPLAPREYVAAEVRAYMARRRITGNQLPGLIGKSQSYWSRRLNGETAFDVDDLAVLGRLLDVDAVVFLGGTPASPRRDDDPDGGLRMVRHQGFEPRTRWLSTVMMPQQVDLAA